MAAKTGLLKKTRHLTFLSGEANKQKESRTDEPSTFYDKTVVIFMGFTNIVSVYFMIYYSITFSEKFAFKTCDF